MDHLVKVIMFFLLIVFSPAVFSSTLEIDVLLGRGLKEILITGMDLQRELFDGRENIVKLVRKNSVSTTNDTPTKKGIKFKCNLDKSKNGKANNVSNLLGELFDPHVQQQTSSTNTSTSASASARLRLLAQVSSSAGILGWKNENYKGNLLIIGSDKSGKCDLVNRVSLERYLSLLLPKEMNASWPMEVLKAQAVASRSFALYRMILRKNGINNGVLSYQHYDLENSEKHQVSGGISSETSITAKAANGTKGEVLVAENPILKYNQRDFLDDEYILLKDYLLTPIFFHARCGGKTLLPSEVWEKNVQGYRKVKCPYCEGRSDNGWKFVIAPTAFVEFIRRENPVQSPMKGIDFHRIAHIKNINLNILDDEYDGNESGVILQNVDNFTVHYFPIKKARMRKYFGRDHLLSNRFIMSYDGTKVVVDGKGHGHGVGLCQIGALEMSRRGWNYKKILKFYFPEHKIVNKYAGFVD